MKIYTIDLFENFKNIICEYIKNNIDTCTDEQLAACLYITQTEFTDAQKYLIVSEIYRNANLFTIVSYYPYTFNLIDYKIAEIELLIKEIIEGVD